MNWLSYLIAVYESKHDAILRLIALRDRIPEPFLKDATDDEIRDWNPPDESPHAFEPGPIDGHYSNETFFGYQFTWNGNVFSFWIQEVEVRSEDSERARAEKLDIDAELEERIERATVAMVDWFEEGSCGPDRVVTVPTVRDERASQLSSSTGGLHRPPPPSRRRQVLTDTSQ